MRINDSQLATSALRHFGDIRSRSTKTFRQLASGEAVSRAGDDNVALHKSTKLRSQIDGANQAVRNTQNAVSLIQVADGGIEAIVDVLQKARRLAIQSANDANSAQDRAVIDEEFSKIMAEIDRQSAATNYNGRQLLDGTHTEPLRFQIGANRSETLSLSLPTVTQTELGLDGISLATREGAEASLTRFDTAIRMLSERRAELGGMANRLIHGEDYTETLRRHNADAKSKIKDLDMGDTAAKLAKNRLMIDTAASALSRASMTNAALATLAPLG